MVRLLPVCVPDVPIEKRPKDEAACYRVLDPMGGLARKISRNQGQNSDRFRRHHGCSTLWCGLVRQEAFDFVFDRAILPVPASGSGFCVRRLVEIMASLLGD